MNPRKVAAHFVAFVAYLNRDGQKLATAEEAGRFARRNWPAFLPDSDDGLGRLLTEVTKGRPGKSHRTHPTASRFDRPKTRHRHLLAAT